MNPPDGPPVWTALNFFPPLIPRARSSRLRSEGYYEGWMSKELFERELSKVERYIKDVEELAKVVSGRLKELEPVIEKSSRKMERITLMQISS